LLRASTLTAAGVNVEEDAKSHLFSTFLLLNVDIILNLKKLEYTACFIWVTAINFSLASFSSKFFVCMVLFHDALLQIRMISEIQSFYLITEVRREASSIRRASLYRASCCIILSYADLS